jgi:FPC/CPF motif-containing protein YcgG
MHAPPEVSIDRPRTRKSPHHHTASTASPDALTPSALAEFVHDSFRALVLSRHFSCVGSRSAVNRGAYRFGLYERLARRASARALAHDLRRFIADPTLAGEPFSSYVASFVEPVPRSERHFEDLLWTTLQQLSDLDDQPWTLQGDREPDSPRFCFSFGGSGFFLVGLHARSSRMARRFAWSTLVFNPHEQFERLRRDGLYPRMRQVTRAREMALQGTVNPMLSDFGEASEARQYSGRAVEPNWRCPFHATPVQSTTERGDD